MRTKATLLCAISLLGTFSVLVAQSLTNVQKADVNRDGIVNTTDLSICQAAFGKTQGQTGYVANCDTDGNKVITVADLTFIQRYLGQKIAPTITGTVTPTPNAAGWNKTDVTIAFTCTYATSCPTPITVTTEGASQSFTRTATGNGGSTSTTLTVNLDKTPPVVTATPAPAANANGWNNTPVVVTFGTTDALSGVEPGSLTAPATLSSDGANQSAAGQATDVAGNVGTVARTGLNIDQTKPVVLIDEPADGAIVTSSPVAVQGTISGGGSPLVAATCNAGVAVISATTFSCSVALQEGSNPIAAAVTDAAGNTGTAGIAVTLQTGTLAPTIIASANPQPNTAGWNNSDVTVSFTCTDATTCPDPVTVTSEGANQVVRGTATGPGGNASTQVTVSVDKTPPTIAATPSPATNTNGWYRTDVTVSFSASDSLSGVAPGTLTSPVTLAADGFGQEVSGSVTDNAGNVATAAIVLNVDKTPPVLNIHSPADGASLFTSTLTATSSVTDALSGLAAVTCNGAPAAVSAGDVECALTFTPGSNSFVMTAADVAGNTTTSTRAVAYTRAPVVTILSPSNSSYLNISPTTVTGTVDDPTATVTINSIPAAVANGSFSMPLPLAEGPNVVTATAVVGGAVGTVSVEVTLDTTPPHVTITSPADQFVTTDAAISVTGVVNDLVVGTVNDQQAQVAVNGVSAQVANRTFLATDVALTIGPNTIQAVGRDRVGNAVTTQITVTRQAITQPQRLIRLVSGNNQTAMIGAALPVALVVAVTEVTGSPVPNQTVVFKVTQNDGVVTAGGPAAATVLATTDAQGRAQVAWTLGHRAGAGGNVAEAYAVGFEGTAVFTASGTQGVAGRIVVDTGNDQIGAINQALPKPFIAVVVDTGNNRLAGVPVTFTVQSGGGTFDGQPTYTVDSDSDGRVAATLTLGSQEGNANNLVEATFSGNLGLMATFTASGRAPGAAEETTIAGVVLDNSNVPIPGVTVRAVLTNVLRSNAASVQSAPAAQTDTQGQFTIAQAPVGVVKLLVDGSTAQLTGTYPSLEYDLVTVSGQSNTVGQPMYLLPLNTANQLCVTATTGGGTLTIPEAPGFSLTFGPGQVTFPGGSQTGCVSVTVVNGDKIPMVPGFGQQPRFIVTIQPAGAVFNPPAPITLPNVDGLKAREVTEMYSYDHDISAFVAIGTGVVSNDGLVIRSSTGVGVLKSGWHCGGNPSSSGTAAYCGACKSCVNNQCQVDDTQVPAGPAVVCQKLACSGGTPGNAPDPSQNGSKCSPATNNCLAGTCSSGTCANQGPNLNVSGSSADKAAFLDLLKQCGGSDGVGNNCSSDIGGSVGRSQPDTIGDSFDTGAIDLNDLDKFAAATATCVTKVDACQTLAHILGERQAAKAAGCTSAADACFDAAHQAGIDAENAYRQSKGLAGTKNSEYLCDANGDPSTGFVGYACFGYSNGQKEILKLNGTDIQSITCK